MWGSRFSRKETQEFCTARSLNHCISSDGKVFSKLQLHLNHSAEVIVADQAIIFLINSKMVDVTEYHATIWVDMGYTVKKLISHGAFLENIDVDSLMKESR